MLGASLLACADTVETPPPVVTQPPPEGLLPARVRRLANAEYDGSVRALLGPSAHPAAVEAFPPDLRQDGFTVNDKQRVDAVLVERLAEAAEELAHEAQANGTLARLAPCGPAQEPRACARSFVGTFGAKAYRRPLVTEEVEALLGLYDVGAEDATHEDGLALVVRGLLQSAGFLYLTELGPAGASGDEPRGAITLTPHELASSLSYFLTSGPPDEALVARATSGALADPEVREAEARRLLAESPAARDTVVRWLREWLGIDRIDEVGKDSLVYPAFEAAKSAIAAESRDFVRAVTFSSTGTLAELFGAHWTVAAGPRDLYQVVGSGPLPDTLMLADRVGILNQAAFLASYANAYESHPVFRGVAVARRVLCYPLDSPASFNLQVVPPVPDPSRTTRERFAAHSPDSICFGCHKIIDPLGFAFEHFDGMGAFRATENGKPVDSAVDVATVQGLDGAYADSNELAAALTQSPLVRTCFARFVYRAGMATGDAAATPGEAAFVELWQHLPAAAAGNILETFVAYVRGPSFAVRERL